MKLHPTNLAVVLAQGALQSIEDGRGSSVQCLEGVLWLTQQGDARDIVLEAGDKAMIERDGTSIVFALSDTRFVLSDARAEAGAMSRWPPGVGRVKSVPG